MKNLKKFAALLLAGALALPPVAAAAAVGPSTTLRSRKCCL